jgi:hypothetical protein
LAREVGCDNYFSCVQALGSFIKLAAIPYALGIRAYNEALVPKHTTCVAIVGVAPGPLFYKYYLLMSLDGLLGRKHQERWGIPRPVHKFIGEWTETQLLAKWS